jgi:hypothetical protein
MQKFLIRLFSFRDETMRRQGRFYGRLYTTMGVLFVIGAFTLWVKVGAMTDEMQRYAKTLVHDIQSDREIVRLNKPAVAQAARMLTLYGTYAAKTSRLVAFLVFVIGVMFIVYGLLNLKMHDTLNRRNRQPPDSLTR